MNDKNVGKGEEQYRERWTEEQSRCRGGKNKEKEQERE